MLSHSSVLVWRGKLHSRWCAKSALITFLALAATGIMALSASVDFIVDAAIGETGEARHQVHAEPRYVRLLENVFIADLTKDVQHDSSAFVGCDCEFSHDFRGRRNQSHRVAGPNWPKAFRRLWISWREGCRCRKYTVRCEDGSSRGWSFSSVRNGSYKSRLVALSQVDPRAIRRKRWIRYFRGADPCALVNRWRARARGSSGQWVALPRNPSPDRARRPRWFRHRAAGRY